MMNRFIFNSLSFFQYINLSVGQYSGACLTARGIPVRIPAMMWSCSEYSGFLPQSRDMQTGTRLTEDSRLYVGVKGCLSLYVGPVMHRQPGCTPPVAMSAGTGYKALIESVYRYVIVLFLNLSFFFVSSLSFLFFHMCCICNAGSRC